jgi:hypothetical protein
LKAIACLVAAAAIALAAAGGALAAAPAQGHTAGSLLSTLRTHSRLWHELLLDFPLDPKPLQRRPSVGQTSSQGSEQGSTSTTQGTTHSLYEQTVKPWVLGRQGCEAGAREESGVAVLDFGKPAYDGTRYGTILFSDKFASNPEITAAMLGYARGYVRCLPEGSTAQLTLARGTSNYHPAVPSAYTAGMRWARWTNMFALLLQKEGLADRVDAAAADDAEPAWDPGFRRTRDFFHGYRMASRGYTIYNYGSLDGGVGAIWGPWQAFYVAGGVRYTQALPEIYNTAMADQWAELARIAANRYHAGVRFAGVMTQGTTSCDCGLRPEVAHRALARALGSAGVDETVLPHGGTNIVG